jgi:hypothetical protein
MTRKAFPALIAIAALVAWQPAPAQRQIRTADTYVHGPAHAHFPVQVGDFRRSDIYQYDSDGKDVSASYNLGTPAGRLLITIYIYPAAAAAPAARVKACKDEFEVVNSAISSQHGNAAPVELGAALPVEGAGPRLRHRSVYRFHSPFDDKVQEIRSEAHLYCYVGGDWLVKYRVSAPLGVDTRGPVEAFIRDGPWPGRTST